MEDSLILDALNRFSRHSEQLEVLLNNLYYAVQHGEANKTPGAFRPYTVNLLCPILPQPQARQILPNNPRRKSVTIYNGGADILYYDNKGFDPASITQQLTQGSAIVEIGVLASKAAPIELYSTGALYCYNEGGAGAALSLLETMFITPENIGTGNQVPGQDGLSFQGYALNGKSLG